MKNRFWLFWAAVLLVWSLSISISFAQEQGREDRPHRESQGMGMEGNKMMREHPGMEWMPRGMARPRGMHMLQMLQHDPKMMGLLMQMHGEMMLKQGEILLKYGKMIQSLPATPGPAKK